MFETLEVARGGKTSGEWSQSTNKAKEGSNYKNTILHFDRSASNRQGEGSLDSNARELATNIDNSFVTSGIGGVTPQVLLQTASVEILDSQGVPQVCRALLDEASQSHLISEECCNRLGLNKIILPTLIVGVGQNTSNLQYRCRAQIQSRFNSFKSELSLIVISKISSGPVEYVNASPWQLPTNLQLADPTFNTLGNIDILIGSGIYLNLLCVRQVRLGTKLPTLQKTQFR